MLNKIRLLVVSLALASPLLLAQIAEAGAYRR
jgi:hypothetical protein